LHKKVSYSKFYLKVFFGILFINKVLGQLAQRRADRAKADNHFFQPILLKPAGNVLPEKKWCDTFLFFFLINNNEDNRVRLWMCYCVICMLTVSWRISVAEQKLFFSSGSDLKSFGTGAGSAYSL
jgi:hypothetical protein